MKMLRILSLLALCALTLPAAGQSASATLWDRANEAYVAGSYSEAIALYDSILDRGQAGAKLYYNLAGAHFKSGHVGESILYYKRAQRLAPADRDIAHNLQVADALTKDRIEPLPRLPVGEWLNALRLSFSERGWAWAALLLLIAAGTATLVYLLSTRLMWRKAGFWTGICAVALLIVALSFAFAARREALHPVHGVVMRMNVAVKSAPDASGKELYIINEGTQVRVLSQLGRWREVRLADGKQGWIEVTAIELI